MAEGEVARLLALWENRKRWQEAEETQEGSSHEEPQLEWSQPSRGPRFDPGERVLLRQPGLPGNHTAGLRGSQTLNGLTMPALL